MSDFLKIIIDNHENKTPKKEIKTTKQTFDLAQLKGKKVNSDLEKIIATSAEYSYWYAVRCLKGPFLLGEEAISSDGFYSCKYAKDVLKARFELGEEAISKNKKISSLYVENVLEI